MRPNGHSYSFCGQMAIPILFVAGRPFLFLVTSVLLHSLPNRLQSWGGARVKMLRHFRKNKCCCKSQKAHFDPLVLRWLVHHIGLPCRTAGIAGWVERSRARAHACRKQHANLPKFGANASDDQFEWSCSKKVRRGPRHEHSKINLQTDFIEN